MRGKRDRLRRLVPSPGLEWMPRLTEVPAGALVDLVLDAGEPWWRRQVCAYALTGRVPADRAMALVACLRTPVETTEVRTALLAALSGTAGPHTDALLAWLQTQEGVAHPPSDLDAAMLRARATLGDLSAAGLLTVLAADEWSHRRAIGEQAIDTLIEARGLPALLDALGAGSPLALATAGPAAIYRLLGTRLAHRAGADITPALADESTMVARQAYELLSITRDGDDRLLELVDERRPGHLWALAVLHRRGHDIRARWEALGPPRVELPVVPADVRAAIVREYAPGERDTDPRWLLEAACLPPSPRPGAEERLRQAAAALTAAGLEPQAPVSAHDEYQQGDSTYHTIHTTAGRVVISTLGPFFQVTGDDDRAVTAMRAAGFRRIDHELGATVVTGLHVYFFGGRETLRVRDLLFYWQD